MLERPKGWLTAVLAPNASPMTLDGTRTYVVGRDSPVVIDPGPNDPAHLAAIEATLCGKRPAAILLTHLHPDHAGGAAALAQRTGCAIRAGARSAGVASRADGEGEALADGDHIGSDAGLLRVVATPGHAPEHLAFHWTGEAAPRGGAAFVGDLLMGIGDTTLVAPPEGNLSDYLDSLRRVGELDPAVLYPTHGPPIEDPGAALHRYRSHRLERISQVSEALRASPGASVDELVDAVYGLALEPVLRGAAAGSIEAILQYIGRSAPIDLE